MVLKFSECITYIKTKQGRIHGYRSRARLGSEKKADPSNWAGAVVQKLPIMPKKSNRDRQTNRPTEIAGYRVACIQNLGPPLCPA